MGGVGKEALLHHAEYEYTVTWLVLHIWPCMWIKMDGKHHFLSEAAKKADMQEPRGRDIASHSKCQRNSSMVSIIYCTGWSLLGASLYVILRLRVSILRWNITCKNAGINISKDFGKNSYTCLRPGCDIHVKVAMLFLSCHICHSGMSPCLVTSHFIFGTILSHIPPISNLMLYCSATCTCHNTCHIVCHLQNPM